MKIIIIGNAKEGKSTMAQIIKDALVNYGLHNIKITEEFSESEKSISSEKLVALRKRFQESILEICTFQAPRVEILRKNVSEKTVKRAIKKYT